MSEEDIQDQSPESSENGASTGLEGKKRVYCEVSLSTDATEAYLTLHGPENEEFPLKKIMEEFSNFSVKVGIKKDLIAHMASQKGPRNKEVLVAQGKKAVNGTDAVVEYKFETHPEPKITVGKDGRANYKESSVLQIVEEGQLLAVKIPATEGQPGMSVTGHQISPVNGQDIFLKEGTNTKFIDAERLQLVAAVNGCARLTKSKDVEVSQLHIVPGNVEFDTGNIRFDGHVMVNGDVVTGFKVEATGDIEIKGVVEDAEIHAGGNIMVRGGTVGRGKGILKAAGNVFVKFVENQSIICSNDVQIADEVIHGNILCGGDVAVRSGKGAIIGGTIKAQGSISAKKIGNIHYAKTNLYSGYNTELDEWLDEIYKALESKDLINQRIQDGISALVQEKYRLGELDPQTEEMLELLYKTSYDYDAMMEKIGSIHTELEDNRAKLTKRAFIKVSEKIFPGTMIVIDDARWKVDEEVEGADTYVYQNGKIVAQQKKRKSG